MKKVLVIQEDIIILKMLERLVKKNGFDCKTTQSLYDLNKEAMQSTYDFVITDILFEGVGPLEFVSQLQEVILYKKLLIVTGMGQDKIKKEIFALEGIAGFFQRPLDLDKIETILLT